MATVTPGYTFTNNEVVTPTKLNSAATPVVVLANNEVTTSTIANGATTTAKIADSNVTTAKIADGAVTQAKLNSSVTLVPTGAVMPFAMNSAPSGWLAANGLPVSRTAYAALFAAIGTTYGTGDGSTTFNLPDLRGYFVRGSGTNSDGTAAGAFGTKQSDAFKSHNHGGATGTGTTGLESQSHTHSGTTGSESHDHAHYVSGTTSIENAEHTHALTTDARRVDLNNSNGPGNNGNGGFNGGQNVVSAQFTGPQRANHAHNFAEWTGGRNTAHTHSFTTGGVSANHTHSVPALSISSDGTTETRPANIALLYCIKA